MQEVLKRQLASLKEHELQVQKKLAEIEAEAAELKQTLQRLAGAIGLIEQTLAEEAAKGPGGGAG